MFIYFLKLKQLLNELIYKKGRLKDWSQHASKCMKNSDPNRTFESYQKDELNKMKLYFEVENKKGFDKKDPERYFKLFRSNQLELSVRIKQMEALETNKGLEVIEQKSNKNWLRDNLELEKKDALQRRALARARTKNLPDWLTVDDILIKAIMAIEIEHDPFEGQKCLSYVIDMLCCDIPVYRMSYDQQIYLGSIYKKKIECNLELGKKTRLVEYFNKIKEDCMLLIDSNIMEYIKENEDLYNCIKTLEQEAERLKREIESETIREIETRNQRRIRRRREEELKRKLLGEKPVIDANLCSELAKTERKLAINATEDDHGCPICMCKWSSFIEARVAAILPCNHAFCVTCLLDYYNQCIDTNVEKEDKCVFQCCLCRLTLREDIFKDVAQAFVDRKLLPHFSSLPESFPFPQEYLNSLAVSKLTQHNFDLLKVSKELSNFIGFVLF
jgi:hypothetical protein